MATSYTPPVLFKRDMPRAFTAPAFERAPCICDTVVWLCAPCGKDLKNADTMYVRGWSYRTRYTHYTAVLAQEPAKGTKALNVAEEAPVWVREL
jgi:hypothetical protein